MLFQEFTAIDIAKVQYNVGREDGIELGIVKGREEGIIKGERAKALSIARGLLSTNLTIEEIARITGLTRDEVNHLRVLN